jgi:hypothetical protein
MADLSIFSQQQENYLPEWYFRYGEFAAHSPQSDFRSPAWQRLHVAGLPPAALPMLAVVRRRLFLSQLVPRPCPLSDTTADTQTSR